MPWQAARCAGYVRTVLLGLEDQALGWVEPFSEGQGYKLYLGDCVATMRSMPEDSVDSLVLDPPAGISFMSAKWDSNKGGRRQWVAWFTEVMEEALRVAKPGAHAFVWALPRTSHWTAWALEDAGWEIREVVHHLFGSGFPKSKNLGNGFGTALKPAAENWILCRAPLSEKSVTANFEKHGTGALNIDESRIGNDSTITAHRADMGYHGGLKAAGNGYQTGSSSGRWPANVLISHHELCQRVGVKRVRGANVPGQLVTDDGGYGGNYGERVPYGYTDPDGFETTEAWECVDSCPVAELDRQSGTSKSKRAHMGRGFDDSPIYGTGNLEFQTERGFNDQGGGSRFFLNLDGEPGFKYCAKSSRSERNAFTKSLPRTKNQRKRYQQDRSGRWLARVICNHPTVKPLALMRYLVKLVCRPGGTVLDPFMGSGTTGLACLENGMHFIGIEQEPDYATIAQRRIEYCAQGERSRTKPTRLAEKPNPPACHKTSTHERFTGTLF